MRSSMPVTAPPRLTGAWSARLAATRSILASAWRLAEPQEDLVAVAGHVVEGEADDAADRLRVKQDEGRRDAGAERQVIGYRDAAEMAHALVVGERRRVAGHRSLFLMHH